MNTHREIAYRVDLALWVQDVLGMSPTHDGRRNFCALRKAHPLALTARQVGKTTAAAWELRISWFLLPGRCL